MQMRRGVMVSSSLALLLAVVSSSLFFSDFLVDRREKQVVKKMDIQLLPDGAVGPESIAFDASGDGPYTGVSDGRILKWRGKEQGGWLEYATVSSPEMLSKCKGSKDPELEDSCGRPLGLKFSESQHLYIADAYLGLLAVTGASSNTEFKSAHTVVDQLADGSPLGFANGLDIDHATGMIYFTDSSMRFRRREFMRAILSGDKTGRLVRYDPHKKETKVLMDGLAFPNGVAVSKDGSFLLVSETATCRVLRYWLDDQMGSQVIAQLPGFPDNIKRSPRGGFWIALHSRRGRLAEWALSRPWLRRLLLRSNLDLHRLSSLLSRWGGSRDVAAVRLSEDGRALEMVEVEGVGGSQQVRFVSEVEERDGTLWLGSVVMPFLAVASLHDVVVNCTA